MPKESDDIKKSFYEKMYSTASYSSFSKIIFNDMLVDILKIIEDKSSINPAGILKKISSQYNLLHATLYRLINTLKDEGIIYISKEAKKNKYYSISAMYLDYMEETYLYIINNFK